MNAPINQRIGRERSPRAQGADRKSRLHFFSSSLLSLRSFVANKSAGGFTLLEMMLALATFILLAAAVFALLSAVLQSTATLQDNQNLNDQTSALNAFLKNKLEQMPARSSLVSYQRGNGEGLLQNGIIFGNTNFATIIDAKVQPNGYYTLRLGTYETDAASNQPQDARQVLQLVGTSDDPTMTWTTLMTDLKTLDWKFLDFNATQWVDLWTTTAEPNLVEFSMQPAGDLMPSTMDFWLPKIDTISVNAAATQAAASSGSPTVQPTNRTPRNQNGVQN
jgi:type II secretory pathway pseudopilin PulG